MTAPMLDPTAWARIQDQFHRAIELSPEARASLLNQLIREDPVLAREVNALLRAHFGPGPLATLDQSPAAEPGTRIGPYRLMEIVGVGGMGVVYRAERAGQDFTQRVALKLIRAGYADPRLTERLRREQRILARLEHPGIARFIDGGTTDTGQSYFAMEFVEGTTLLEYSSGNGLGIPERLRLFIQVCQALHHAHQQLVVHGDLKPGNIMVTPAGHPKLLDFGIAELMDTSGPADGTLRTVPWFTPDYAGPEQIRGERLTTHADVYSLGVVLYELLAGQRPWQLGGLSPAEMERLVCEQDPRPPSEMVNDAGLRRRLAGDLDTIVLKALAKEPARRYQSAEQLAADLERHLDGRPVRARPDSRRYRFGKFVRRHRTLVGLLSLLFLTLVGGIAAVAWQAADARRQRDAAEVARGESDAVSDFMIALFEATDPRQSGLDSLAIGTLLQEGLARADELAHQPRVQARLLDALATVHLGLARHADALALFRRSLELRRRSLGESHPVLARSYAGLALAHRERSEMAPAESLITLALTLARDAPPAERVRTLLAAANIAVAAARLPDGERHSREAQRLARDALALDDPLQGEATRVLASLLRRQGKNQEAIETYEEYVEINRRANGPSHPLTAGAMVHLGNAYEAVSGRTAEAESLYRAALRILEESRGANHPSLNHGRGSLAGLLSERGAHAAAESLYRVNLAVAIRTAGAESHLAADNMAVVSNQLRLQGRLAEASRLAEEAVAMHRRIMRPGDPTVAAALHILADIRLAQGRGQDALELAGEALELRLRAYGQTHQLVSGAYEALGRIHFALGHRAVAESLLTRSLAGMQQVPGPDHPDTERVRRLLSVVSREPGAVSRER